MAGLMVPAHRLGEFFGLWTFAIRLASILGPLTYGLITWLSDGNQRLAIGSTSLLFRAGAGVVDAGECGARPIGGAIESLTLSIQRWSVEG
jgi:MFS-type transporter involved in bile tolerance (Atg22 family)